MMAIRSDRQFQKIPTLHAISVAHPRWFCAFVQCAEMMVGSAKAVEGRAKITMPTLRCRHQTQQLFRRLKSQQRDYFQHAIVTAPVAAKRSSTRRGLRGRRD